jgi:hypothetical protein
MLWLNLAYVKFLEEYGALNLGNVLIERPLLTSVYLANVLQSPQAHYVSGLTSRADDIADVRASLLPNLVSNYTRCLLF